jgi:hypothetical protein
MSPFPFWASPEVEQHPRIHLRISGPESVRNRQESVGSPEEVNLDMGTVRPFDRRRETRTQTDLALTVWGVDTKGQRFLQEARARDISLSGALLSGLDIDLSSGDVIGILYAGRKARYRVVWVRYDGTGDKMQVAVHRITADACPWQDLLPSDEVSRPPIAPSAEI